MASRRRRAGLTLVETALLISMAGVVLAVSIPTFMRVVRSGKISEATEQLEQLHRAAAAYYASPQPTPEGNTALRCLPPAAGPTPAEPSEDPVPVDFTAEDAPGAETWKALGFAPERTLRFRYSFIPRRSGCGLRDEADSPVPFLLLRAEGDLDSDGERSVFERVSVPNAEGDLVPDGPLIIRKRVE